MAAEEKGAKTERYREVPAELLYSRTYEAPSLGARLAPYGFGVAVLSALGVSLFLLLSNPVVEAEEVMTEAGEIERLVLTAKERMNRARAAQGSLAGEIPVSVFTDPDGAQVEFDFENVGTTPLEHHLRPGVYMLSIRKPDYASVDTILFVESGEMVALHFELGRGPSGVSRLALDDRSTYEADDPLSVTRGGLQDAGAGMPDFDPPRTVTSPATSTTSSVSTASPSEKTSLATAGSTATLGSSSSQVRSSAPQTSEANMAASAAAAELVVSSHPTGAEAFLDGERVGTTPISIRGVAPGFHQIRLLKDGFELYEIRLRAGSGETETVHGELVRRFGRLGVLVRPWGSIYIDGVLHEKATDVKYVTSLPVGEYTVTAVHPDLGSVAKTVQVDADALEEIVIEFQ